MLEDAGVKLSSVASNMLGVSDWSMLEALCQGTNDPVARVNCDKHVSGSHHHGARS